MSFSENDVAMLAAFDVSLLQDGIDGSGVAANVNNNSDRTVSCNVIASLTDSEPDELNSKEVLPEHGYNCREGRPAYSSSCTDSEIDSSKHKTASVTNHCTVQNSRDSPDYVVDKQPITCSEVELATNDCQTNAAVWPTDEAVGAPPSVVPIQRKSVGRLSEKIKQTLQQNAKVDTPTRLNRLSAVMEKYDTQCTDVTDIGPFYGLPLKVKQLLETQRSITEFYREFSRVLHMSFNVSFCDSLVVNIHS